MLKETVFSERLLLPIDGKDDCSFNRFTLTYTASHALRGSLVYTANGEEIRDPFFLEPGSHVFSCVS